MFDAKNENQYYSGSGQRSVLQKCDQGRWTLKLKVQNILLSNFYYQLFLLKSTEKLNAKSSEQNAVTFMLNLLKVFEHGF